MTASSLFKATQWPPALGLKIEDGIVGDKFAANFYAMYKYLESDGLSDQILNINFNIYSDSLLKTNINKSAFKVSRYLYNGAPLQWSP